MRHAASPGAALSSQLPKPGKPPPQRPKFSEPSIRTPGSRWALNVSRSGRSSWSSTSGTVDSTSPQWGTASALAPEVFPVYGELTVWITGSVWPEHDGGGGGGGGGEQDLQTMGSCSPACSDAVVPSSPP